MELFWETIRAIIAILFTFSVSIFVHELGHFSFAKLFKVPVGTFSIGFGRAVWARKWGETTYQIALIPFGGYVSMGLAPADVEEVDIKEEGEVSKPPSDTPALEKKSSDETDSDSIDGVMNELDTLRQKSWIKRILILSAGCINNLITAVAVYFFIGLAGYYIPAPIAPIVESTTPDIALKVDIHKGDKVVEVAGHPVKSDISFDDELEKAFETSATVPVSILRNETTVTLAFPKFLYGENALPGGEGAVVAEIEGKKIEGSKKKILASVADAIDSGKTEFKYGASFKSDGRIYKWKKPLPILIAAAERWPIGIEFKAPPYIGGVMPNLSAEKCGMKSGDLILTIDGKSIDTRTEARKIIREMPNKTAKLTVERTRKDKTTSVLTLMCDIRANPDSPEVGQIGIVWGTPQTDFQRFGPLSSAQRAVKRVVMISGTYLVAVCDLFTHSFQTIRENMGGPVMIGVLAKKAADRGLQWFFEMFALFNIILAVTNLLPLPILDGGHIVFTTIEAIIRRPLPEKLMTAIFTVFFWLLIALAILLTFNDIIANAWRIK